MRFSFYSLLLLFCLAQISFAQESPARRTFSLGSRGIWSESGLVVTSGSGLFHRSGCKGSFYQVHLALDYLYQPWFSGGAEVRITGGVDDAENAFAFNRYYLRARFFQEQGNFLLFASPLIGMDQGYSDLFYIQEDGLRPEGTGEECLELNDDPTVVLGIEGLLARAAVMDGRPAMPLDVLAMRATDRRLMLAGGFPPERLEAMVAAAKAETLAPMPVTSRTITSDVGTTPSAPVQPLPAQPAVTPERSLLLPTRSPSLAPSGRPAVGRGSVQRHIAPQAGRAVG